MSVFPARKASLVDHSGPWTAVISTLLKRYALLYRECCSRADKFSVFQVRWNACVRAAYSTSDVELLDLAKDDKLCVLHSVGAATWKFCCLEVKRCVELSQTGETDTAPITHSADKFSTDHVYRFFGAALIRCIRVLADKDKRQQGKMNPLDKQKLALYHQAVRLEKEDKEVTDLPPSLRIRDRGWMTFLKPEFLPFAEHAMREIFSLVNHKTYQQYGEMLIKQATTSLLCDKSIAKQFKDAVQEHVPDQFPEEVIVTCAEGMCLKVLRATVEEVIDTTEQMQIHAVGSTSTSGQNLRDRLHL